jgi:hypothetical protein
MRLLRSRLARTVAAVTVLVTGGASLLQTTPARAAARGSAAQLLAHAFADARAEGSFHLVSTEAGGGTHASFVQDVGEGLGRQRITNSNGVVAHVEVTGSYAYFDGNRAALLNYFGLPTRTATTIGSRWVSLSRSDSYYATVAADVTMQTALNGLGPVGKLSVGPKTKVDGQTVVGIFGRRPGSPARAKSAEIAYLSDTEHPLPVVISSVVTQSPHPSVSIKATFSDWREHLSIPAPAGSVTYDSLGS